MLSAWFCSGAAELEPSYPVAVLTDLPGRLRSRVYRAHTRLPPELRDALVANPVLAPVQTALQAICDRGPLRVAGGIGKGLAISTEGVGLTHIQAYGIARGSLEVGVQEALRRHLRPGHVFYDIGANIGFFSLVGARLVGPSGRVIAFEPVLASANSLRANVTLNDCDWVTAAQVAIADYVGTSNVSVAREQSWSHLADQGVHPLEIGQLRTEVTTIDRLCSSYPTPDVIKIDVEGYELEVLRGMRTLIGRHRPAIICELHANNAETVSFLAAADYSVINLDSSEPPAAVGPTHVLAVACESNPQSSGHLLAAGW